MAVELSRTVVLALAVAALLIGLAKGGLAGGLGPLITMLLSVVLPTRQAVGVLLPLLMVGDLAAARVHRRDWDRDMIRALLPPAAGVWRSRACSSARRRTG